jgi:hypothetical protein
MKSKREFELTEFERPTRIRPDQGGGRGDLRVRILIAEASAEAA